MTGAAVWGVGTSEFGRFPGRSPEDLVAEATAEALTAAGVEPAEIEAVVVGNVFGPSGVAARAARAAGVSHGPVIRVEAACASGTLAVHSAAQAVAEGRYGRVLAVGVEHLSARFDGAIEPERSDAEGGQGLPLPGLYALQAHRYLHVHRRDPAELAAVAVKNRAQGSLNDRAHRRHPVTTEEVLGSRMIADPLTVLQCCPLSDGAAAAVLGPPRAGRPDVPVLASVYVGGQAWPAAPDEPWSVACIRRAAREAEAGAGLRLAEADLFEVHDAFTIGEVLSLEALGLCRPGESLDLLHDGVFSSGGRRPVNLSGGLLARGHALGATGVAQVAEVVWQLTGKAGARQLGAPKLGVVETMGGGAAGLDGNAAAVLVLGHA
ncbi:thiolase family protein [Acrocarpospora catenulata]|uniref:thiolase family protein n=1 Tax=Acrocarpospora catenulata TaxID=2836182 RepID=UPI001BD98423|nr:thiolase family protein [Acrocarpospora catenulata]